MRGLQTFPRRSGLRSADQDLLNGVDCGGSRPDLDASLGGRFGPDARPALSVARRFRPAAFDVSAGSARTAVPTVRRAASEIAADRHRPERLRKLVLAREQELEPNEDLLACRRLAVPQR